MVPRIRVSTLIDADPRTVWADVSDLSSHVEWMHDARSIEFVSDRVQGVGATFDCLTRIGPFRLTDRMEITRWVPERAMGVRHVGLVTGTGQFTLRPVHSRRGRFGRGGRPRRPEVRTRFTWSERLRFPWWMGGPVGAWVARPVLRRIWRRNLALLRARFEH